MTQTPPLTVPRRFNGPPASGNGGWVAGAVAARLTDTAAGRAATVTLRQPPPLDTPIDLHATEAGVVLGSVDRPVAEASYAETAPVAVAAVEAAQALAAEARFAGHVTHPFRGCFVCGTDREPGDGLRIFAGRLAELPDGDAEDPRAAATWTPAESTFPITWAALDCPSAWASDIENRPAVLGRMTALVKRLPVVGETHVVVGEVRRLDGRKSFTASSLYDAQGDLVATAGQIWITIDPSTFG